MMLILEPLQSWALMVLILVAVIVVTKYIADFMAWLDESTAPVSPEPAELASPINCADPLCPCNDDAAQLPTQKATRS